LVTHEDLAERGVAVARELGVLGATGGEGPVVDTFRELTMVTVMGAVWSRPGLDLKTRTLVTVVSDIATGRFAELPIHTRMARHQGWTRDELVEVGLHLSSYVGAPLAREALMTLDEIFAAETDDDVA
jgi:4-carboxymuconolactone decarboxylase